MSRATNCWWTKTRFRGSSTIRRWRTAAGAQATLDARNAAVREAEQNIVVAQSAVEQADQRIPQADASIESAMTAPQQVEVSEARAKSAQAQVAQKKALLDQAKLNLSYCTIVAPVTGIVGKKTVELGQNISPGRAVDGGGSARRHLGHREFQGNAVEQA